MANPDISQSETMIFSPHDDHLGRFKAGVEGGWYIHSFLCTFISIMPHSIPLYKIYYIIWIPLFNVNNLILEPK